MTEWVLVLMVSLANAAPQSSVAVMQVQFETEALCKAAATTLETMGPTVPKATARCFRTKRGSN
jgi:hypothetical protein